MKQKLLWTAVLPIMFIACRQPDARLQLADDLMERELKDSACSVLAEIREPEKLIKPDYALYALLSAEVARYKDSINAGTDSLLSVALDYYRQTTDTVHIARSLFCAGYVARQFQLPEEAMKYFLEALRYSEGQEVSDKFRYAANTWAGVVVAKERLFADKISYSHKALAIARRLKNSSYECISLGDIAYGHLFMARYDSALHYTEAMHQVALRDSMLDRLPYIYTRFMAIYTETGQYDLALKYVNKALQCRHPQDTAHITGHYSEKSTILGKLGQYDSAYYYFQKSAPCPDPFTQEARYYNMADTYHAMGRYKDAYQFLLRYTEIDDSIKAKNRSTELIALQNLYEHERLRAENLSWQAKVTAERYRIYWVVAIAIALLWIAGGVYFIFYRRNRRRLIVQQTQLIGQQQQIISQQEELQLRNEERVESMRQIAELREKENELKGAFFRQLNLRVLQEAEEASKGGNIILSDKDWEVITENADAIFNRFTIRLLQEYPNLNKEDLRYCCMVKMQLSQQEIAQIMHLEKDSVKKRLKRIRVDKMGSGSGVTLEEFLRNF